MELPAPAWTGSSLNQRHSAYAFPSTLATTAGTLSSVGYLIFKYLFLHSGLVYFGQRGGSSPGKKIKTLSVSFLTTLFCSHT